MKKSTADFLAYEMARGRFSQSNYSLNEMTAKELADFIQTLSSEFQKNLDDLEPDVLERFKHLSK
ncbi:hypothetical protein NYR30_08295 [Gallibacterium salpingitidis]|uniref:hypothetical protein n=1 Tax=Gallibacterium TaxID=155493 RepID=UPI0005316883|nr:MULTISPECIES: hypothetical protein [Gallibacterium]KGQ55065.1 hypothetical protein IO44_07875 [Gallibacterium anatis str. Avicor]WAX71590.1 hypothetical protein CF557_00625 [Gallibacterium anatis]WKS98766.1 hypothetical protein NYR30_08295 [Gallibacterium salpingitidis]